MNQSSELPESENRPTILWSKWVGLVVFLTVAATAFYFSRGYLNWDYLVQQEGQLLAWKEESFILTLAVAFVIYVLVTGLSLPGALILSLLYAWYFKFTTSVILISFASTTGATVAFLTSRYFFFDVVQTKFAAYLESANKKIAEEGNFYLFILRLVPAVPFFAINVVMGLTKIRVTSFWWVSQVGMLPGTLIYCYAGSRVPNLKDLQDGPIKSEEATGILIALVLLVTFPLIVKWIVGRVRKVPTEA